MTSTEAVEAYLKRVKKEQKASYELYCNYIRDIFLAHFIDHRVQVYSGSITINIGPGSNNYSIFLNLEPMQLMKRSVMLAHRLFGVRKPCEYCVMEDGKILRYVL